MTMASEEAEALKMRGNEKYKACAHAEAIDLYKEAATLQPDVPIYLSNLSAAQLEHGQYIESLGSCDGAISLIQSVDPTHKALRTKLLNRRAKLLTLLHAEDQTRYSEADSACDAVLSESPGNHLALGQKHALGRHRDSQRTANQTNQRLTDAPKYRNPMEPFLEYFTVGQDCANSIFRRQYTTNEDPTETHPSAERFHIRVPRDGTHLNFSALFCGIGDARHLYASLADVGFDLAEAGVTKPVSNVKVHFTMVDIHPAALSRDLIVFTLLSELSSVPKSQHVTDPRALDLLLTLHYVYLGTTMPPSAHAILEHTLDRVCDMVRKAAEHSESVNLPWLYIEPKSVCKLRECLTWWNDAGKNALSFSDILPERIESDGLPQNKMFEQLLSPQDRAAIEARRSNNRDNRSIRGNPTSRAFCEAQAKELGTTVDAVLQTMSNIPDEEFEQHARTPHNAWTERRAWKYLKVMVPPSHAKEPEELDDVFRKIRSGDVTKFPSANVLKKVFKRIKGRWRSNFTLLDEGWLAINRGKSVNVDFCPFQEAQRMFSEHYMSHLCPSADEGGLYEWSATFFSLVADGVARLKACGPEALKLEIVCGDGFALMEQIRMNTSNRNPDFPVNFDRIHCSNVPDYIGGYLASFTTAVPLLKPHPASYLTSCSLLSTSWEGGMMSGKYGLNLDSALYTYAGVTRAETPAAYGVSFCYDPAYPGHYQMFRGPERSPTRLDRGQIVTLAYACFIKTVLPVRYDNYGKGSSIREVVNVHAFFRLMETLKNLGYAPHVLAEIVESILHNQVNNSPQPHNNVPIPLASRNQPKSILCTTPFAAEFEVAAAMWEPRLFPICSTSVPATDDIIRYSVRFEMPVSSLPMSHTLPLNHFVLALIFGLPRDLDAGVENLRKQVTGTRNCLTSVQLVSTFDYAHDTRVATFLLSRARAEQFIQSGYEVAILSTAFWRIQSKKVRCADMRSVGNLDVWDKSKEVANPMGREPTERELQGWLNDTMGSFLGGPMGGMGGQLPW